MDLVLLVFGQSLYVSSDFLENIFYFYTSCIRDGNCLFQATSGISLDDEDGLALLLTNVMKEMVEC